MMLPKPWRRALLFVVSFFSFYILLAFLAIDEHEKQVVRHLEVQNAASKVLLWTNHSDQDNNHVVEFVAAPPGGSSRHVSSERDLNGKRVISANQEEKGLLVRVWPSLSNRSTVIQPKRRQNDSITTPVPTACDPGSDCERLQERLLNWPRDRPKAVIYYLTRPQRLGFLRTSLESVDNYFNSRFKYPIVIFHESDLTVLQPAIRHYTTSDVYFQQVHFSIPDFLTEPVIFDIPCISAIGYRHMCRFNAKQVYEQPIMQNLDFYWRLDDDSRLLRPVNFDPFLFMERRGLVYGYQWIHLDNTDCVTGLWEATEDYIKEHNIKPYFFDKWPKPKLFYNNFEISRMDVWTSPAYKQYIEYLDRLGGMYYHRWGDAPIRGLSLSLFVPMNKTFHFKDIGYEHTSFRNP